jgi:exopolyphosphatase
VLAYLRTYAPTSKRFYIPLANLARADLVLRPELGPVLRNAGVGLSDLATLCDLKVGLGRERETQEGSEERGGAKGPKHLDIDKSRWVLVDHNALQGELGKLYAGNVVGVIDHHDEENQVPVDCGEEPRVVRPCGSCASLVVEWCRPGWDAMSKEEEKEGRGGKSEAFKKWDGELAMLAMAPILVDTTNLTNTSRVTQRDREAVEFLEECIKISGEDNYSSQRYFKELTDAKEDIDSLSLYDILRKDYKLWVEGVGSFKLGISSVVKNMQYLIEKASGDEMFNSKVREFAEERGLNICAIMTTSHEDDIFRRELFVWALGSDGVIAAKKFEAAAREKLALSTWGDNRLDDDNIEKGHWRRCWWQHKVEHSRKQVAPLMRASI